MSSGAHASDLFVGADEAGPLAAVDPRVRLAVCLAFLFALPALHGFPALAVALGLALLLTAVAGIGGRAALRRLAVAEGFLVALLVSLPFLIPGRPAFALFGLAASWDGILRALVIVLRINAGILVTFALIGRLGSSGLARAMTGLGFPEKLAQILQMTVRYIALFDDEYHRLRRAMRARGFKPGSNRHSWRSYGHLLGMLVLRSFERAERVRWAMLCRGFSGRFLTAEPRPLAPRDHAFAATAAALILALLLTDHLT